MLDALNAIDWLGLLTIIVVVAVALLSLYAVNFVAQRIVFDFNDIRQQVQKAVTPAKPDSWQTLIWISVFSWITSLLPRSQDAQSFIASVGWLFLIPGVHWALHDPPIKKSLTFNGFFIGPWITGALVCVYIFGALIDAPISVALICWPPISAIIASLPKFVVEIGPKYGAPSPPDRQKLIILLLSNLVVSCWFQLYFSTQDWLEQYPSLLADDMSRSSFVVQLGSQEKPQSRGMAILEQGGTIVQEDLVGQPWAQVERWLLNLDQQVASVQQRVDDQLAGVEENSLWRLQGQVLPRSEYVLQLAAVWLGPTVDPNGYHFTRTCQITKIADVRAQTNPQLNSSLVANVQCQPIVGPIAGQPQQQGTNSGI